MEVEVDLIKLELSHAQRLFDLTEENREFLREWLPWLDAIKSCSDTRRFVETSIATSASGGAPNFAVTSGQNVCGIAGFNSIDKANRIGVIGYWISENYGGKGIATQSVSKLMRIGFNELGLNKIEIRCASKNNKSRAIAERLGFTHEATLRQSEWLYETFVDHEIYSLLAEEFNAS